MAAGTQAVLSHGLTEDEETLVLSHGLLLGEGVEEGYQVCGTITFSPRVAGTVTIFPRMGGEVDIGEC